MRLICVSYVRVFRIMENVVALHEGGFLLVERREEREKVVEGGRSLHGEEVGTTSRNRPRRGEGGASPCDLRKVVLSRLRRRMDRPWVVRGANFAGRRESLGVLCELRMGGAC
jgi:hypothetical protein